MTRHFGYTKRGSSSSGGGGGGSGSTLPCPPDHPRTGLLSAPQNLLHQTVRRSALNPPTHTKTRGTHAAPSRRAGNRQRRGNTFRGGTDVTSARASPRRATHRERKAAASTRSGALPCEEAASPRGCGAKPRHAPTKERRQRRAERGPPRGGARGEARAKPISPPCAVSAAGGRANTARAFAKMANRSVCDSDT